LRDYKTTYPGTQIHITGVALLDPALAWPRQDNPDKGIIDGVPTPNEMWRVFVDVNEDRRSGTIEADVACWYAGTLIAGLDRLPPEIVGINRVFTEEEKISIESTKITHPW
jgi:hypothetical protein